MIRATLIVLVLVLAACGGEGDGDGDDAASPSPSATQRELDDELRTELLAMMEQDQAERTGDVAEWNDQERTDRLAEIIDEHGWPGSDLVGTDGANAAWVIAQHSDLDPAFQQRALELMRPAVAAGLASPGDLAYLEDRVGLNAGGEQVYGTQIGCVDGVPEPAPLTDPETVDERRAEAGLEPLDEYLATLAEACAAEAGAGTGATPSG